MSLRGRSFQVVPETQNDLGDEVVLVPWPKASGKRERVTNLSAQVIPGTTSGNDLGHSGQSGISASPIVKWVGGKTKLLPELQKRIPSTFGRYYEPFAGGAALFFKLAPEAAVLGDANADLIACYQALADDADAVIESLTDLASVHCAAHYYAVRDAWNTRKGSAIGRAAAFLYLNRAGYNGLYRVNRDGALNVPFGKAAEVSFNLENLRAASRVLARAELRAGDYRDAVRDARAGDLVYLDPPYDATFNAYTSEGTFDQATLSETVRDLAARGCHVVLSSSDTPRIRELYAEMDISVVRSPRSVNSDGAGRGDVDELIITNRVRRTMARQTEIPGTEAPDRVPAVEEAISEWLDAKVQQRRAADETKTKHAAIIALYAEHGIDVHPYSDPKTGKPKRLWLAKEPKAKSSSVPVPRVGGRRGRRGGARREADAVIAGEEGETKPVEDTKVEFRRVPRKSVEKEFDGFASVRERMEAKQADAAKQAEKLPTRGNGKRGK
jgi:DNA adenine methylase